MKYKLIVFICLCAVGFGIASFSVEIPRIVRAPGYTVSTASMWKAVTPQLAVVVNLHVSERAFVKKGQIVADLSAERFSQNKSVEAEQSRLAKEKLELGRQQLDNLADINLRSMAAIRRQMDSMRRELTHVESELKLVNLRLADLSRQQVRHQTLVSDGFISQEALETKNSEMLRLQAEKSASERQQLNVQRELDKLGSELALIELRAQSQRAQLVREIATAQQEFNEHSSKQIQLVSAIDGIVTQVYAQEGQVVRPEIPLLAVIPVDTGVEVTLLLPSRSIGFVRDGQRVSVRYQAYPHEHYGRHFGTVRDISRVALPPQEVAQHIRVDEPVYTVRVKLPANHMTYQDKKLPVSPGMVVDADIELDRLKIYQWLLEPLYRLGGRV
jgi:membrane fusion protein